MKTLKFIVTIEGLPDHAKDYRVAGDICSASFVQLRAKYPDGQLELGITPAAPAVRRPPHEHFVPYGGATP